MARLRDTLLVCAVNVGATPGRNLNVEPSVVRVVDVERPAPVVAGVNAAECSEDSRDYPERKRG